MVGDVPTAEKDEIRAKDERNSNTGEDMLSDVEKSNPLYDDSEDTVVVTKRDPESAPPVRVASLDYVVPEKAPQPSNVLESLVWEREKDVDRLRERLPMARAMMLARAADAKFPIRSFMDAITSAREKAALLNNSPGVPLTIVSLLRASLHHGNAAFFEVGSPAAAADAAELAEAAMPSDLAYLGKGAEVAAREALMKSATEAVECGAVMLGTSVDSNVPKGSYEDLETIKQGLSIPIIADDFIM